MRVGIIVPLNNPDMLIINYYTNNYIVEVI